MTRKEQLFHTAHFLQPFSFLHNSSCYQRERLYTRPDARADSSQSPHLDLLLDRAVFLILGVVFVRQAPLVTRENRTGLEDAVDLSVDVLSAEWGRLKAEAVCCQGLRCRLDCKDTGKDKSKKHLQHRRAFYCRARMRSLCVTVEFTPEMEVCRSKKYLLQQVHAFKAAMAFSLTQIGPEKKSATLLSKRWHGMTQCVKERGTYQMSGLLKRETCKNMLH